MEIVLTINGVEKRVDARPSETLLDLLRRLGYQSVKFGCGEGACGSCTVIMDSRPVNSCLVLAVTADGREILTVDGLGTRQSPHPLQTAFVDAGAVQCGFCTPGMILSSWALLERNPDPGEGEIREALDGNLCRCTGYVQIVEAVKLAAGRMRPKKKTARKKKSAGKKQPASGKKGKKSSS
jgi:aerobic-type carbon monoxide dehydrogenase small subunit (CoxS/CutS family)